MSESPGRIPKPWETQFARIHPQAYLYVHALLGSAGVGLLLWLFLAIADEIPEHGALARFDDAAATWLQRHGTETGETRATWSFPSGHAMESLVGYGFIAYLAIQHLQCPSQRRHVVAVVALLVGLIGYSRVYLGVHYVSDVIGGYLAGAAWLLVCISGYRVARRRR